MEKIRQRWVDQGFEETLNGAKRSALPVPKLLDGELERETIDGALSRWLRNPEPDPKLP